MSTGQAKRLKLKKGSRWSPYLEKCCLLVSANESYQRASEDIETLTGIKISHSTLQRMVGRQEWEEVSLKEPIREMSLDGGMVRLRTPQGQVSEWREYKALNIQGQVKVAFFKDNKGLLSWINSQPLSEKLACLGDGHDGVWNIFAQVGIAQQREEILDWYHLMENLHKVQGTQAQLSQVRHYLWQGQLTNAIRYLSQHRCRGSNTLIQYLRKHQSRMINYQARQATGGSVGSGAVESLVKQIGLRVKLPGAQWSRGNVPRILQHRCAYLNGAFAA